MRNRFDKYPIPFASAPFRRISLRNSHACVHRILVAAVVAVIFVAGSVYGADPSSTEFSASEKIPRMKEKVSTTRAMIFDLVPGGGHFYLGNYGSGAFFGIMKTGSYASILYFYSQWQDSKTKYRRASDDQANKYKLRSDRAAQRMTFSVIGSVVIQAASWIKVWSDCSDINSESFPVFDIGFRDDAALRTQQFYCGAAFHF
jgi:hypothetical protein